MKVLVIGATGMLGYSLFSNLSDYVELDVYGTVRSIKGKESFFYRKLRQINYTC
jgi:dTDP-4-dehydrorhamnose reductase